MPKGGSLPTASRGQTLQACATTRDFRTFLLRGSLGTEAKTLRPTWRPLQSLAVPVSGTVGGSGL